MSVHIRDPVHNFIRLQDEERRLLGTPVFQRLRGIRQLALATLVYPGALHTRFDHSLGVMHVAGQMAQSLGMGEDDIGRVRLAALLHDVGHGPFSHVSEYALERYADRTTLQPEQKKEKIHELVSALIIRNNADIVLNLGQAKCDEIAKLLATGYGETALRQVVSGPLDADKQDYLLRDTTAAKRSASRAREAAPASRSLWPASYPSKLSYLRKQRHRLFCILAR